MLSSVRRLISYPNPDRSDRPDIPAHIQNLVNALEVDMIYAQGTDAARIARAHLVGTFFYATDTTLSWYDDGATWRLVGPLESTVIANGHRSGTLAARPLANAVAAGTLYYATDKGYVSRSDGAAWTVITPGAELDSQTLTADSSAISATTEGTAPTVLTANSAAYDGTKVRLEFVLPYLVDAGTSVSLLTLVWVRDGVAIGQEATGKRGDGTFTGGTFTAYDTPSAGAHTYSIKAFVNGASAVTLKAGAGGAGAFEPMTFRATKA